MLESEWSVVQRDDTCVALQGLGSNRSTPTHPKGVKGFTKGGERIHQGSHNPEKNAERHM